MKSISKTLTLAILPLFLISCQGNTTKRLIYDYLDHQGPLNLWGKNVEIEYSDDLNANVDSLCSDIKTAIGKEDVTSWWLMRKINSLYSLSSKYNLAASEADLYSAMLCTKESFDYYSKINESYINAVQKMNEIEKEVVKSTKYRDDYIKAYYPNLKGQELEDFINGAQTPVDTTESTYSKQMSSMESKYRSGQISAYEFFSQYIPIANDYAELKGFDNFIDYQYAKVYGRDYTRNDIASFESNAVNYVPSLIKNLQESYLKDKAGFTQEEIDKGYNLTSGFFGNNLLTFEDYAKKLGGNFFKNYEYLLDSGNYFLSDVENSPYTAYCNSSATFEQYLFFSRNYQDIGTFSHEFGHYNAGYESSVFNYDIFETQSQGDELLFGYYLENYSNISPNSVRMYVYGTMANFLHSVMGGCYVDETEQYFYTHEGMSEEEMLEIANQYAGKYGLKNDYDSLDSTYFGMVSPNSTAYYISYSVSAMASLSLYSYALDKGFDAAKSAYKTIYSLEQGASFGDMIEQAKLYNPLTDDGFAKIINALE